MNYETRNSYRWVVLGIAFLLMSHLPYPYKHYHLCVDRIMDDIPYFQLSGWYANGNIGDSRDFLTILNSPI